jgi:outer membrane protein
MVKMKNLIRVFLIVTVLLFHTMAVLGQGKPLTLDACVEIALEKNPEIVMGQFTVQRAGKDVVVARANFLPTVNAGIGYDHSLVGPSSVLRVTSDGVKVPVAPDETKSWASWAGLQVNQTLFSGGYNIFNYSQSRSYKKSAEYDFENTRQTIIYYVKERYYNLLKAEKLLCVQEESFKSFEESHKRAETLFEIGKVPKSDALNAKYELENSRLLLIEAGNSLSIAIASLNHILGFEMDYEIKVVDDLDVYEMEMTYDDVMENAFQSHPALLKGSFDVKASKAGVKMAVSRFLPTISASYQYSWSHARLGEINNMFDTDYRWSYGLSLSLPIFQGFTRIALSSRAKLDYKTSMEMLAQTKRDIAFEAKQAYFDVAQAKKKIAVAKNSIEYADENHRLNREKYNLGAGTMLDLIYAQVSASEAKSNHIQALYDYKFAIARLQKAMGKLQK